QVRRSPAARGAELLLAQFLRARPGAAALSVRPVSLPKEPDVHGGLPARLRPGAAVRIVARSVGRGLRSDRDSDVLLSRGKAALRAADQRHGTGVVGSNLED